MEKAMLIKGRLVGPTRVELDEAVITRTTEVEVLIRPEADTKASAGPTVSGFLRGLPPGTRSRTDIDSQIHTERTSWGDN